MNISITNMISTTSQLMVVCLFGPPGDNASPIAEVAYNIEGENVTIHLLSTVGNLVKGRL